MLQQKTLNYQIPNSVLKFLIACIFIYSLLYYIYYGIFQPRSGRKPDFDPYWTAAYCLKNNINPYNVNDLLETSKKLGAQKNDREINKCVYPPLFMQILKPFLFFNIQTARAIWSCIVNSLFVICIIFLFYDLLLKNFYVSLLITSLFFLFRPLYITLALGQVNIFIFFLLLLAIWAYNKKKNWIFSAAIALASLIKIIPFIIYLFLILRKKYKLFFIALFMFLLVFLVSYLFNPQEYKIYFFEVLPQFSQGAGAENLYNISLDSFLKKHNISNIFQILFQIILILLLIAQNLKYNTDDFDEYIFGMTVGISLLIPKTLWEHHLLLIFIVFFILLKNILNNRLALKNNIILILFAISISILLLDIKYYDGRLNDFPLSLFRYIKLYAAICLNFLYILGLKKIT